MHRKLPVSVLVYNHLFPTPRPDEPTSFSAHLSKNLVGEVRIETATFYGSLDTIEARYPGLNYSHPPHRKRLGRFPHHARLFAAFDDLGLTDTEIAGLCRWEGTLWARQRYERDEGIKVLDTTGSEIGPWVDHRRTRRQDSQIKVKTDIDVEIEDVSGQAARLRQQPRPADEDMMEEDSDEDMESIGIPLNQRLIAAAVRREQGATSVVMDADWEKYLERAQERGEISAGSMPFSIPSLLARDNAGVPTNPHDRQMPPAPPSATNPA